MQCVTWKLDRGSMACSAILTSAFPSIDGELLTYVTGVLEDPDDFNNASDVYEAVGGVLHEVARDKEEEEILSLCGKLLKAVKVNDQGSNSSSTYSTSNMVLLDAPVHIGAKVEEEAKNGKDDSSIWMMKKANSMLVDKKKLEKADAKIKAKQEQRAQKDKNAVKPAGSTITATASQAINRKDQKMDDSGNSRAKDVRIENFDLAFGDKVLLKEADLTLSFGRRYGFVGRNGAGKSTLLKMISSGELRIPSHISILHVEQEVIGDDTIATDSVLQSDETRERLVAEERQLVERLNATSPGGSDPATSSRLAEVYVHLEEIEADKAPARAAMILAGLGFSPTMQRMKTREFSGGWRMRLALARALFSKPDLLLLDEPTNMLDIKAILWLESYLQGWPTTLLVVSHDKNFLNVVSTDILFLHSKTLDSYRGDYEVFFKTKTEKLTNQQKEFEAQQQLRAHVQVFIDRFRYNANRAALVQSKIKFLEKLPVLKPVEKESDVILRFPAEFEKLSPPILQLDEVAFYYSKDKPIFKKIDISANMESRTCMVGENGSGKTTLLKILIGQLEPISGVMHRHRNLRIGYFSQHHVDQLDMEQTSVEVMASRFPGHTVERYRHQLGSFGVTGELATRTVSSLSGGQKSRVAFALMCMGNPNFLVLDEPTNHLDIETVEALGKAINTFKGGVMLVSHDESLIRLTCKELWVCADGDVKSMEGGLDEYKRIVEAEFAAQK
ncbi:ATP-binding cassette sub-family F member 3-like [Patiria miniata]|uniref:ATP-binding cassette sub-family F member 3 n=1 Tax=Patiria miniata TaxID=46514 RepID=A0A914ABU0_PATMI|nr:ATP-binding cassette sub-family F member 3-like [Patiria miniata]